VVVFRAELESILKSVLGRNFRINIKMSIYARNV
jgi:hypothetical protein